MKAQHLLRLQAHANQLCNERLHQALSALDDAAFHAQRVGFFPSLAATLNHILAVDLYYVAALEGHEAPELAYRRFAPAATLTTLREQQRAVDSRLVAFCQSLTDETCHAAVAMPRRNGLVQRDTAAGVLLHLFMHQHHHRGQAHAMLSSTAIEPPQLDEFMMPSEGHLRAAEMARLGWLEADIYGPLSLPTA